MSTQNYDTKGIAIYIYERDYSLMNNLVAFALKEYEEQELKNNQDEE